MVGKEKIFTPDATIRGLQYACTKSKVVIALEGILLLNGSEPLEDTPHSKNLRIKHFQCLIIMLIMMKKNKKDLKVSIIKKILMHFCSTFLVNVISHKNQLYLYVTILFVDQFLDKMIIQI
jgi:hypothetical protein